MTTETPYAETLRGRLAVAHQSLVGETRTMYDGYEAFVHFGPKEMADRIVAVVAEWLRAEETGDLMAEATEQHHITDRTDATGNNLCACGNWADTADMEGWDQHMAYVGLEALARTVKGSQ